jgi:hypothetical protein
VPRSQEDLIAKAHQQLEFLRGSASAFDQGNESESLRMAACIRILLHDTNSSISLFNQLGIKNKFNWINTSETYNPNNLLPTLGLVMFSLQQGGANYQAPLDVLPPHRMNKTSKFEQWWTTPICHVSEVTWSREEFMKVMANKEGGAHVDPLPDLDYNALVHKNAIGWVYSDERGERPVDGNLVAVSIRQMAFEVLTTCDQQMESML